MTFLNFEPVFRSTFIGCQIEEYGKKPKILCETAPRGVRNIIKFEKLEKGCLTWLENEKYPMRGHMINWKTTIVTQVKHIIPQLLRTYSGNWFKKLIALLYFYFNWQNYLNFIHRYMLDVYPDPDRYNQPVRELYRVFSGRSETFDKIRNIMCAIFEYDMAYRYRFQDTIVNLNKQLLAQNPIKEIQRLLMILADRDYKEMRFKWETIAKLLWFINLSPKLKNMIKDIFQEIDLEEVKSSVEDLYWQNEEAYKEVKFRGIPFKEREKEYLREKEEYLKNAI